MTPDDSVTIFTLNDTGLRGRIISLGPVLDAIMTPHDYPPAVHRLVAETALLAVLLSSMLKYEGIFTLQAQGDGPVAMVVADVMSGGDVRACATIREGRREEAEVVPVTGMAAPLLGKGYMAFTVDQGAYMERYQGIVELKDGTLSDSVQSYFRNSEQIATGIRTAIIHDGKHWRAGGILIQHVPEEGGITASTEGDEDGWRRTMLLLQSCTNAELTDPGLSANDVLYRLFHEEGITVQPVHHLHKGCRCTPEKLESILATMTEEDRRDMTVDGKITMNCAFCSKDFVF